jgi:hypothetical protein
LYPTQNAISTASYSDQDDSYLLIPSAKLQFSLNLLRHLLEKIYILARSWNFLPDEVYSAYLALVISNRYIEKAELNGNFRSNIGQMDYLGIKDEDPTSSTQLENKLLDPFPPWLLSPTYLTLTNSRQRTEQAWRRSEKK